MTFRGTAELRNLLIAVAKKAGKTQGALWVERLTTKATRVLKGGVSTHQSACPSPVRSSMRRWNDVAIDRGKVSPISFSRERIWFSRSRRIRTSRERVTRTESTFWLASLFTATSRYRPIRTGVKRQPVLRDKATPNFARGWQAGLGARTARVCARPWRPWGEVRRGRASARLRGRADGSCDP